MAAAKAVEATATAIAAPTAPQQPSPPPAIMAAQQPLPVTAVEPLALTMAMPHHAPVVAIRAPAAAPTVAQLERRIAELECELEHGQEVDSLLRLL